MLLPEKETTYDELANVLRTSAKRKKLFSLIIVAEGNKLGKTEEIAEELKARVGAYAVSYTHLTLPTSDLV